MAVYKKEIGKLVDTVPVILCGGSGTRLWPLSRIGFPKQFLCFSDKESLFQQALKRLLQIKSSSIAMIDPIIVTGEEHRFLASEQMREVGIDLNCALLEPSARNTAPAMTLAALKAIECGGDPVMVVSPADQAIGDVDSFLTVMRQAVQEAQAGTIVILGIVPDRAETGYGYIEVENSDRNKIPLSVRRFVEKPDLETAQAYVEAGNYYWNSGMFVLKASVWLDALKNFRPDIYHSTSAAWATRSIDKYFIRPGAEEFSEIPGESIDYAVIENCPNSKFEIKMLPLDARWSDLGAWDAVWDILQKDGAGNVSVGDVIATDCRGTYAHATSRLVSLVGVDNLVVVETPDAVLVANKSRSQAVKEIVNQLVHKERDEHKRHRKVYRPWGWYDSTDEGNGFKVKRIQVKPKASLSLQKHAHRAEHWIVVKGTAEITNGDKIEVLSENQSTYIPLGVVHRLTNRGATPLEIIEVQSGSYLEEDDIVRLEDSYGRADE